MIVFDEDTYSGDPSIRKQPSTPPAASEAFNSAHPPRNHATDPPHEPQPNQPLLAGQPSQPLGPPPAYSSHDNSGYQTFSAPPPPPPQQQLPPPVTAPAPAHAQPVESAGLRFMKAFIVAVLIYVVFGAITGGIVDSTRAPARRRPQQPWRAERWDGWHSNTPYKNISCTSPSSWTFTPDRFPGEEFPHMAELDGVFDLQLFNSDLFLFGGRGIQANVTFVDDDTLKDLAHVKVTAKLDDPGRAALMDTTICRRSFPEISEGITFSSTASDDLLQYLHFDIVVSMATYPSPQAMDLPELMVQMASMNLDMRLSAMYTFRQVKLWSNHGSMHVDRLTGSDITLRTAGGAVTGSFTSDRLIALHTLDAPINVQVAGRVEDGVSNGRLTEVMMMTSNSPIHANISLHSVDADILPFYRVVAESSNGSLEMNYAHIPLNAKLNAFHRTTNASVLTSLDNAFEGSFELVTTGGGDTLVRNGTAFNADAGHNQRRDVRWRSAPVRGSTVAKGVAAWTPIRREMMSLGSIHCETTDADVTLLI